MRMSDGGGVYHVLSLLLAVVEEGPKPARVELVENRLQEAHVELEARRVLKNAFIIRTGHVLEIGFWQWSRQTKKNAHLWKAFREARLTKLLQNFPYFG